MCPSAEKPLIRVGSAMEMIRAAMPAKIHVPIALGDSWMPVEFVAEIIYLAQDVTAF